jgi:hypothetical protein
MVYPRGTRKPGVCRTCALKFAGVRHVKKPSVSKREFRRRRTALTDAKLRRPRTLADAMEDLRWLDTVDYGAEAGGRGRRVAADPEAP